MGSAFSEAESRESTAGGGRRPTSPSSPHRSRNMPCWQASRPGASLCGIACSPPASAAAAAAIVAVVGVLVETKHALAQLRDFDCPSHMAAAGGARAAPRDGQQGKAADGAGTQRQLGITDFFHPPSLWTAGWRLGGKRRVTASGTSLWSSLGAGTVWAIAWHRYTALWVFGMCLCTHDGRQTHCRCAARPPPHPRQCWLFASALQFLWPAPGRRSGIGAGPSHHARAGLHRRFTRCSSYALHERPRILPHTIQFPSRTHGGCSPTAIHPSSQPSIPTSPQTNHSAPQCQTTVKHPGTSKLAAFAETPG